jgi:hypothetical protein
MSIICEGQEIDLIIAEFGTDITLYEISQEESIDEYHSVIDSKTTTNALKVIVEKAHSEEERVREGIFHSGDLYIHFKTADMAYAKVGNKLVYAGENYKIVSVDFEERASIRYVTGAKAEKI